MIARGVVLSLAVAQAVVVAPAALSATPQGAYAAAEPAAAAAVPCTRTFAGPTGLISKAPAGGSPASRTDFTIAVPASSNVEDVNAAVSITHPKAGDLRYRLVHRGVDIYLQARHTSDAQPQVAPLTWDDEAAGFYDGSSPAGTYKPWRAGALSNFDGTAAGGGWTLGVENWDPTATARVTAWSITISYTACDEDADGVDDHVDNCLDLPNGDQTDLDGDGLGNPCDPDLDGDGVPNNADNCLTLPNADQADADGDGAGDPCDSTPTVPTDPPAPTAVERTVALAKQGRATRGRAVTGRVRSDERACRTKVRVQVMRAGAAKGPKAKTRDRKVRTVRTGRSGRFTVRVPRPGRYFAVVERASASGVVCAADRSRTVRFRR